MIREITANADHPDRGMILPPPEEVERRRKAGDPFIWKINQDLLRRRFPSDGPEKGSDGAHAGGANLGGGSNDSAAIIQVLREQLQSKDGQIRTLETQLDRKDDQIKSLSERMHESNVLMRELQARLAIAAPAPNRSADESVVETTARKGSDSPKPPATPAKNRSFFGGLFDPLQAIGFDRASIARILKKYPTKLVQLQLWADITLAAVEQGRVKDSPPAFFQYYIARAAEQRCTPPDWWREIDRQRRRAEEEQRAAREQTAEAARQDVSFEEYLAGEAQAAFDNVMQKLKDDLVAAGRSENDARDFAKEHALIHFRNKFRQRQASGPLV